MEIWGDGDMQDRWVWAEIDLGAIAHNFREIRKCIHGGAKLCAVVKANGYGHGAIAVAHKAVEAGADYLAVATLPEALELRRAGFMTPILILGLVPPEGAAEIVANDITQAVCTPELAEALSDEAVRRNKTAKVHLKVDTGMGRIGVRPEEAGSFARLLRELPNLEVEGVFSHFALADSRDKSYVRKQLDAFETALRNIKEAGIHPSIRHIAESAAILEIPEAHYDMVRAGIIEYGLWPSDEVTHPIELRQAMRLCARIAYIKTIQPGESVSYGRDFIARRVTRIATLPLGYADGYIRAYGSGNAFVEIRGKRAPLAGRVCMDQVMVDVTDLPEAREGDEVTLFGSPTLTADEAAKWLHTINYEITCMVSGRVPRKYIEGR